MRAIDADTLRERLQNLAYDDWNQGITTSFADACNEIIEVIEEQPTIEPSAQPEIIRCKNCEHWINHCCYERNHIRIGLFTHENDYCSWARREKL